MSRQPRILHRAFNGGELSPEMFGQLEDAKFQSGAALIRNMICRPQGPAFRRPGLALVRAARNSAKKVRLLPFAYSETQGIAVEAGRATIDAREIGYFRFHTQGGTVLYERPSAYVEPETCTVTTGTPGSLTTGTSHDFQHTNPVVFTLSPSATVTFTTTGSRCLLTNADTYLTHGVQVIFGGSGTLPTGIERYKVYYCSMPDSAGFGVATERFGTPITLSNTGSGTLTMAAMPSTTGNWLDVNKTYPVYRLGSTSVRVAWSTAELWSASFVNIAKAGNGVLKMHYAYGTADLVTSSTNVFYCMRSPWGEIGSDYCWPNDHTDHATTVTNYWCKISGTLGSVSTDAVTDRVTWVSHGFNNGDVISFSSTGLPSGLTAGTGYFIRNKAADDFQLSETLIGPILSIGTSAAVNVVVNPYYEVPHYYAEDDLFHLETVQSNDVLTIACRRRPVAELRRYSAARWTWGDVIFGALVPAPKNVVASTIGYGEGMKITSSTTTSGGVPGYLTTAGKHGFAKHEPVHITGITGAGAGLSDGFFVTHADTAVDSDKLPLRSLDTGETIGILTVASLNARVRSSTGNVDATNVYAVTSIDINGEESEISNTCTITNNLYVSGAYNELSWEASGAERYRVYKQVNGLFGLIGDTQGVTFKDDNIEPDLSIAPPILDRSLRKLASVTFGASDDVVIWPDHGFSNGQPVVFRTNGTMPGVVEGTTYYVRDASSGGFRVSTLADLSDLVNITGTDDGQHWGIGGDFPGAVAYFEGRRVFASSLAHPQTVWTTASGTEADMSYSQPTVDSDRIKFTPATREFSAVQHVVPLSHLVLLASSAEVRVTPVNDDALTPTSISVRPQSYVGSSSVQPAIVNNIVVFAAARGGHVREMGFNADVSGYLTGDLSMRASHLFDDKSIVQMAYQKAPLPTIWCVSSDGKLLGVTYVPEEQVGAWHQHTTTDGLFESVVVIPEGGEDRVYAVVLRGSTRFIERMASQSVSTLAQTFFVDCGAVYSGPSTSTISGLEHLNGKTVAILADGLVQTPRLVSGGQITLTTAASYVVVGLACTAELVTLPLLLQADAYGTGRTKNLNKAWVRVFESGAFNIGPYGGTLMPALRIAAGSLATELVAVTLSPSWNDEGQLHISQSDPLPLTVVGLTLEVAPGG